MANKGNVTKSLAIVGTVLAWFPIVAPILLSVGAFIGRRVFRLDYLMPAELFPAVLVGGALLLWAAARGQSNGRLIGWSLAVAVGMLLAGQGFAVVTGMASGQTEPASWLVAILIGTLVIYIAAVVAMGAGGVLLIRDLFRLAPLTAEKR